MDLDREIQEYRAIRDWLKGKKPAPTGRAWRRTLVTAVTLPLPAAAQEVMYQKSATWGTALRNLPSGLPIVIHAAMGGLIIASAPMMVEMAVSAGSPAGPLDGLTQLLTDTVHVLQTIGTVVGGLCLAFGAFCFAVNGR